MNATILIQDDEILDRDVRPFAEESDSLQGFQILLDSHSSWAGFGAEYLDVLREEFPKASIWTWGIEPHAVQDYCNKTNNGRQMQRNDFHLHNFYLRFTKILLCIYPCIHRIIFHSTSQSILPPYGIVLLYFLWHMIQSLSRHGQGRSIPLPWTCTTWLCELMFMVTEKSWNRKLPSSSNSLSCQIV